MALQSPICETLKIDVPIVLAGMGGASNPALTAAVSNAGGLGVLGPQRMDYGHIIPLVRYCSRLLTGKLAT